LDYRLWESIIQDIETIEPKYSLLGSIFSLGYAERVRREALTQAARLAGGEVDIAVDVGAGPGDSTRLIASLGAGYVVAVEPSSVLVQKPCSGHGALCDAVQAVAEYLPLRDKAASLASSFYAVRDYGDTQRGLSELARVADVIAVGDIFVPRNALKRLLVKTWVCVIVPPLAALLYLAKGVRYRGICRSLQGWCSLEELAAAMAAREGFNVKTRSFMLGGLGYVVAWKNTGGPDRGQRHTLRGEACRGSERGREPGGPDGYKGGREGGAA